MMKPAKRVTLLILGILLLWAPGIHAQGAINPYLQNMVDVRASSDESWQEAQQMISRLNHVENSILYQTAAMVLCLYSLIHRLQSSRNLHI
ncbi:hypothetical protein [Jeotgalicoccus sp. WY2]|uniref:hypothetical protein n=1 Tax=Jeotgalicoccus sp. WY2 TaxID=2708346 RepID=UPI001BD31C01|nr:hypothetical protein [Jeotgalicoccus sp. WY2]